MVEALEKTQNESVKAGTSAGPTVLLWVSFNYSSRHISLPADSLVLAFHSPHQEAWL
jgi:hypothetical protein